MQFHHQSVLLTLRFNMLTVPACLSWSPAGAVYYYISSFLPFDLFPVSTLLSTFKKALFVTCAENSLSAFCQGEWDSNAKRWCHNTCTSIHQSEPTETASLLSCYFLIITLPVQNFSLPFLALRLITQKLTTFLWLPRLQHLHAKASMTHSKTYSFCSSTLENWSLFEDMVIHCGQNLHHWFENGTQQYIEGINVKEKGRENDFINYFTKCDH